MNNVDYRLDASEYCITVNGAFHSIVLTLDDARGLIRDLEHAVTCVEAGADIRPCTCGRMPLLYEPRPNAGVWKAECTICRKRTDVWAATRSEAVRRWNRMVGP